MARNFHELSSIDLFTGHIRPAKRCSCFLPAIRLRSLQDAKASFIFAQKPRIAMPAISTRAPRKLCSAKEQLMHP